LIEGTCYLPVATAREFVVDALGKLGVPEADARVTADVLISADLRGIESHGIGRLLYYFDRIRRGQHKPVTHFEIVREGPTTALVDGNHGMGHVIGVKAMRLAMDKARTFGTGVVVVRNSTHYGIAGYYPLMAVKEGMVGMSCTNARPSIAPTFSAMPMLGTNPIAFGAPTDEDEIPFLFDAATSMVHRGTLEVLSREKKPGQAGWAVNSDGSPALDPGDLLSKLESGVAALLPLGGAGETLRGYKGYGLATMVEVMSSALQGGAFLHGLIGFNDKADCQPYRVGHFFMAIDVERFLPLDEFKEITGTLLRQLREAPRIPGARRIYTAGEKEAESERRVRCTGIPIVPSLQKDLKFIQSELRLNDYSFPF
jgi:LDH2 family malate/lactate/ureidoglycolate dehydrogenase